MQLFFLLAILAILTRNACAADADGTWKGSINTGKLVGNKVLFTVQMDFGTLTYEGTVSGNELKFIVSAPDGSYAPMNCKKQS
jgi:hypothetical protein